MHGLKMYFNDYQARGIKKIFFQFSYVLLLHSGGEANSKYGTLYEIPRCTLSEAIKHEA